MHDTELIQVDTCSEAPNTSQGVLVNHHEASPNLVQKSPVYIDGLPSDISEQQIGKFPSKQTKLFYILINVAQIFSAAGSVNGVKLYRTQAGRIKVPAIY